MAGKLSHNIEAVVDEDNGPWPKAPALVGDQVHHCYTKNIRGRSSIMYAASVCVAGVTVNVC